jgi:GNAT superfamily N-acetyltransferase
MNRELGGLEIRPLIDSDPPLISEAFQVLGLHKPEAQYVGYLVEQRRGVRQCWVALIDGYFVGYVTLQWNPLYPGIAGKHVPEIQDLNVLPAYRRRGIATQLLDRAERTAAARVRLVAIGVGLHPGYNAAQRLYVLRGYAPDGLGVTYEDRYVQEGEVVRFDDELVLHFTKALD